MAERNPYYQRQGDTTDTEAPGLSWYMLRLFWEKESLLKNASTTGLLEMVKPRINIACVAWAEMDFRRNAVEANRMTPVDRDFIRELSHGLNPSARNSLNNVHRALLEYINTCSLTLKRGRSFFNQNGVQGSRLEKGFFWKLAAAECEFAKYTNEISTVSDIMNNAHALKYWSPRKGEGIKHELIKLKETRYKANHRRKMCADLKDIMYDWLEGENECQSDNFSCEDILGAAPSLPSAIGSSSSSATPI